MFRRRDVRILVDGKSVASLPFPKPASPYAELPFELDGNDLIGVSWLPTSSWAEGLPLRYDLISNGHSLCDGATIEDVRHGAPAPGAPYPRSFYYLDMTLQVAPAAASPGLILAIGRSVDRLGWLNALASAALLLASVWTASWLASRTWRRVRGEEAWTVRRRVALGWGTAIACYAFALAIVVVLLIGVNS